MTKRTTIEIDEELLARAKRALPGLTTRATVEEALRRIAEAEEAVAGHRADAQRAYLQNVSRHLDVSVLASDDMWR
jgi:Arc/MetJ family transcription regulator